MLLIRLFITFQLLKSHGLAHPLSLGKHLLKRSVIDNKDIVHVVIDPGTSVEQDLFHTQGSVANSADENVFNPIKTTRMATGERKSTFQFRTGSNSNQENENPVKKKVNWSTDTTDQKKLSPMEVPLKTTRERKSALKVQTASGINKKINPGKYFTKKKVTWSAINPEPLEPRDQKLQKNPEFIKSYINGRWKWRHFHDVRHKDPEYIRQNTVTVGTAQVLTENGMVEEPIIILREPPEMKVKYKDHMVSIPADFMPYHEEEISHCSSLISYIINKFMSKINFYLGLGGRYWSPGFENGGLKSKAHSTKSLEFGSKNWTSFKNKEGKGWWEKFKSFTGQKTERIEVFFKNFFQGSYLSNSKDIQKTESEPLLEFGKKD